MASVQEHRDSIQGGYDTYIAELKLAGPHWEVKPASGEGEDAWCARQVAEHVAAAGTFFAYGIAKATGGESERPSALQLESMDGALAATTLSKERLDAVLAKLTDEQLSAEMDFRAQGGMTKIDAVLGVVAYHYTDHANQLKTLRGG